MLYPASIGVGNWGADSKKNKLFFICISFFLIVSIVGSGPNYHTNFIFDFCILLTLTTS